MRVSSLAERLRSSLFFVPMISVLPLQSSFAPQSIGIPRSTVDSITVRLSFRSGLTSTVDNYSRVAEHVAGATITFAGIRSPSLAHHPVGIDPVLAAGRHTLFRDPFNKRVIGIVIGTFTYCVIVFRSVPSAIEQNRRAGHTERLGHARGRARNTTILAIIAFINHRAHAMDMSEILDDMQREAIQIASGTTGRWAGPTTNRERRLTKTSRQACRPTWRARSASIEAVGSSRSIPDELLRVPSGRCHPVSLGADWGSYAIAGTPLCQISTGTEDNNPSRRSDLKSEAAVYHGQDPYDATRRFVRLAPAGRCRPQGTVPRVSTTRPPRRTRVFHSTAVLAEILRREPPPRRTKRRQGPSARSCSTAHPRRPRRLGLRRDAVVLRPRNQVSASIS